MDGGFPDYMMSFEECLFFFSGCFPREKSYCVGKKVKMSSKKKKTDVLDNRTIEKLINFVSQYPVLYDASRCDHHDQQKLKNIWKHISKQLFFCNFKSPDS